MANWDHKSNIGTHPELGGAAHNGLAQVGGSTRTVAPPTADETDTHVPVGSLVTITIGRNVPAGGSGSQLPGVTVPMSEARWQAFQDSVRYLILEGRCDAADVFGPFAGHGVWDGVREDSVTFTGITARPFSPASLDNALSYLARCYDQDAIAWSYGPARLARR